MGGTRSPFFPVMGVLLDHDNTVLLNLSPTNKALMQVDLLDDKVFYDFIFHPFIAKGYKFGVGGYGEKRAIYSRSKVFATPESVFRDIHLGIDVWSMSGSPVFCPFEGKVHSFKDNLGFGNYGPTLILEHQLQSHKLYSLYGHLSRKDLVGIKTGQRIKKGQLIGHLGTSTENGNWPPHLHFQLIKDMENQMGDYPGVCSEMDKTKFLNNCPNPNSWLGCPLLETVNN